MSIIYPSFSISRLPNRQSPAISGIRSWVHRIFLKISQTTAHQVRRLGGVLLWLLKSNLLWYFWRCIKQSGRATIRLSSIALRKWQVFSAAMMTVIFVLIVVATFALVSLVALAAAAATLTSFFFFSFSCNILVCCLYGNFVVVLRTSDLLCHRCICLYFFLA